MYALLYGKKDFAKTLIDKGALINVTNKNGWTPLMFGIKYIFSDELAVLMISKGAEVHAKSNKGDTPLKLVREMRREQIINLLIEKGAKE